MESKKIADLFGNMKHSLELHRQAEETMRKLILAVAREHLKQNNVTMTIYDWEETRAALKLMTGESKHYQPSGGLYLSRHGWPTHLRLSDLKPVRVESGADRFEGMFRVRTPRGKVIASIMPTTLEGEYMRIRDENA